MQQCRTAPLFTKLLPLFCLVHLLHASALGDDKFKLLGVSRNENDISKITTAFAEKLSRAQTDEERSKIQEAYEVLKTPGGRSAHHSDLIAERYIEAERNPEVLAEMRQWAGIRDGEPPTESQIQKFIGLGERLGNPVWSEQARNQAFLARHLGTIPPWRDGEEHPGHKVFRRELARLSDGYLATQPDTEGVLRLLSSLQCRSPLTGSELTRRLMAPTGERRRGDLQGWVPEENVAAAVDKIYDYAFTKLAREPRDFELFLRAATKLGDRDSLRLGTWDANRVENLARQYRENTKQDLQVLAEKIAQSNFQDPSATATDKLKMFGGLAPFLGRERSLTLLKGFFEKHFAEKNISPESYKNSYGAEYQKLFERMNEFFPESAVAPTAITKQDEPTARRSGFFERLFGAKGNGGGKATAMHNSGMSKGCVEVWELMSGRSQN